jgi:hypothetical protein
MVSDLIPLQDAAALVPGRPHHSTLWRWTEFGLAGVKLPTTEAGGRRFVTVTAIDAFLAAVSAAKAKKKHQARQARRARKSSRKTAKAKR